MSTPKQSDIIAQQNGFSSADDQQLFLLNQKIQENFDSMEAGNLQKARAPAEWKADFEMADRLYRATAHLDTYKVTEGRWEAHKRRYHEWEKQNGMESIFKSNILQIDWEKFKESSPTTGGNGSKTSGSKSDNSSEESITPTAEKSSFVFTEPKASKGS